MTFSAKTKNEISRLEINDRSEAISELAGIIRMNGSINISKNKMSISFNTENAAVGRRIFSLIKFLYSTEVEVKVRRNKQLKKNNNYTIGLNQLEVGEKLLKDVYMIEDLKDIYTPNYLADKSLIDTSEKKRAFLRGSFLGSGSVSNPERNYHLELVTSRKDQAEDLIKIINSFNLSGKMTKRKDSYIVYLKEAEQVSDFLNIVGAHQALLKFEDIRIMKDIRNNVNRLVNCETANMDKTIKAAVRQVEYIKLIDEIKGIDSLPDNLREIAILRLNNPEASLKELGLLVEPNISKSGVNHRLRRIEEIGKELLR